MTFLRHEGGKFAGEKLATLIVEHWPKIVAYLAEKHVDASVLTHALKSAIGLPAHRVAEALGALVSSGKAGWRAGQGIVDLSLGDEEKASYRFAAAAFEAISAVLEANKLKAVAIPMGFVAEVFNGLAEESKSRKSLPANACL